MATERLSLRAAERVFGAARHTISRWLGKKAAACPPLSTTLLPAESGDVLELAGLWSFVGSKANACRVWVALCRQTRQIIAYFVGDRSAESACALRARLPPDYRRRATRRDFWLADAEVFAARTHRLCGKSEGETCHVERGNNTPRQRQGRFVRKTLSFSKCDRMHALAWRLFVHAHNQHPVT